MKPLSNYILLFLLICAGPGWAVPLVACSDERVGADVAGGPRDAAATDGSTDLEDAAPADGTVVDTAVPDLMLPDTHPGPWELRIMAANLTSGPYQSYDPGHGMRILQAFAPDIVLIQEFNFGDNSAEAIATFVTDTFGPQYHHYREVGALPNGVISRYPILDSGEWEDTLVNNRDFAWARVDLPGPQDLWCVSVHFLTSKASDRAAEANELIDHLQQHVPAGALLVLGGDFNTGTRTEDSVNTLSGRFIVVAPYPEDQAGNGNTNADRQKPLDWVVVSPSLQTKEVPLAVGQNSFPHGLVFDSRVYQPLADLPPVQPSDSAADQMQHMAVIRQFRVPQP